MTARPTTIAVLGYGRFGRALCELIEDAGLRAQALDSAVDVPDPVGRRDLPSVLAGAQVVVLATPVHTFRSQLQRLRPHLTDQHLVLDVGSVKTLPQADLRDVLGAGIPWVATHPLFGPASMARGERPLRVVVCPNELHPTGVDQARWLYERIGCEVIEQDATTHDEAMAQTHALVFFLAKALLDIGAERVPFAPPSFQAISAAVEAVRADAGHLFLTIQNSNPHSAAARRSLIEALRSIHEQLDGMVRSATSQADGDSTETWPQSLRIPDLGAAAPDLLATRELIDELDGELMVLLARRAELSRRAGRTKAAQGGIVRDPAREQRLLDQRASEALSRGLDAEGVRDVFEAILRQSRTLQRVDRDPI